jgi:hypothetical protein
MMIMRKNHPWELVIGELIDENSPNSGWHKKKPRIAIMIVNNDDLRAGTLGIMEIAIGKFNTAQYKTIEEVMRMFEGGWAKIAVKTGVITAFLLKITATNTATNCPMI